MQSGLAYRYASSWRSVPSVRSGRAQARCPLHPPRRAWRAWVVRAQARCPSHAPRRASWASWAWLACWRAMISVPSARHAHEIVSRSTESSVGHLLRHTTSARAGRAANHASECRATRNDQENEGTETKTQTTRTWDANDGTRERGEREKDAYGERWDGDAEDEMR
jgi:hypothetical protein